MAFFEFCPECGNTIGGQVQVEGKMVVCKFCNHNIGIPETPKKVLIDHSDELIKQGKAGRCTVCNQVVELRSPSKNLVPHYAAASKKICPGSSKPPKS